MMNDPLIALPDGSFVRASHICAIQVRAERTAMPGVNLPNLLPGLIIVTGSGGYIVFDMPGIDEAKAEAQRVAALCTA
jgi:hypothetical protein